MRIHYVRFICKRFKIHACRQQATATRGAKEREEARKIRRRRRRSGGKKIGKIDRREGKKETEAIRLRSSKAREKVNVIAVILGR